MEVTTVTTHKIRRFSAGDVLDQRTDIVSRLVNNESFRDLMIGTMSGSHSMRHPEIGVRSRSAFIETPALTYSHLRFGEVFRVSADMTELITHAAALLDDTDQWNHTMLPTECGFVRFDAPLVIRDARNNDMLIHAMTWGPAALAQGERALGNEATFVTMWNDTNVEPDFYAAEIQSNHDTATKFYKIAGQWSFIGAEVLVDDTRVGPALIDPATLGVEDEEIQTSFTNTHRLIMAMCMLMDQTIVDTTQREKPNVHARRRAKERKLSTGDITVVTLRRRSASGTSYSNEPGAVRAWHHRWVVRGHWRWARVGPGRQETRRVWVAGYVKGPEDKPLRITQKVYDLKR